MACVFSFLLISVRTNFSLSSPCTTTSMEKQTNPNRKTNKPKREKKKRDRSVLKKKKNPNGKTNKPKRQNKKETDRCLKTNTEIFLLKKKNPKWKNKKETDRCLSERLELVGLAWSELVGMGLNRSSKLWIGATVDRCL